jgi:hypothetical protein
MANARIRLAPQTIEAVTELGQKCGIDDADTVIKLLIRKYADNLIELLSPSNPNQDSVTQIGTVLQPAATSNQLAPPIAPPPATSTRNTNFEANFEARTTNNSKPRPPIEGF